MIPRRLHLQCNILAIASPFRKFITFTMADVPDHVNDYRRHWNRLLTYLRRHCPEWHGIRTHELFPGRWGWCSHGLHTHVVCNDVIKEKKMREIARRAGFGRVSYKDIEPGTEFYAARYLAKYLGKKRAECLKGWQLVRTFGNYDKTRQIDIVTTSALTEAWAYGKTKPRWANMSFYERSEFAIQIRFAMLQGKIPCESYRVVGSDVKYSLDSLPF